jgi:hypothetical protein
MSIHHPPLPLGRSRSGLGLASGNLSLDGAYGLWTCLAWTAVLRTLIFFTGAISVWTASRFPAGYATGTPWIAFDSMSYLTIVLRGYELHNEHWPWIAFFPGYPLASRLLSTVFPPAAAMLIVSNTCAMVGFGLFYQWAKDLLGARAAFISTLLLAAFPGAVFFSAGLTEGPFMMLSALALVLASRDRWYLAACACGVASFTRPTAIALAAALVLAFLIERVSIPWPKRLLQGAVIGVVCMSGAVSYEAYLVYRTGDARIYTKAQKAWEVADDARRADAALLAAANPAVAPPRHSFRFYAEKSVTPQAWNRALAIGILTVTLYGLVRRTPIPPVWFVMPLVIFLLGYLPNNGLRASSVVRYEMAALPVFLAVGWWFAAKPTRRPGLMGVLSISLLMQVYYAVCFGRGIWVG